MAPRRPGGGPRRALTATLLMLAAVRPVAAAGLHGIADAFLLDAADTAALLRGAAGPDAAAGSAGGAWVAAGQARLWGMAELPVVELSGGLAWPLAGGTLACSAGVGRTGRDLVRLERRAAALSWRRAGEVRLEAAGARLLVGGEEASGGTAWRLAAGPDLELGRGARLALRFWALLGPAATDQAPRPVARAVLLLPGGALALAWDRRPDGAPAPGAEGWLTLGVGAAAAVRWDGPSGSLGPGLALRLGPVLLRTSHAVHPALGVTHRFELTAGGLRAARR